MVEFIVEHRGFLVPLWLVALPLVVAGLVASILSVSRRLKVLTFLAVWALGVVVGLLAWAWFAITYMGL